MERSGGRVVGGRVVGGGWWDGGGMRTDSVVALRPGVGCTMAAVVVDCGLWMVVNGGVCGWGSG